MKLVAHRGFAGVAPENTVRAVRAAAPGADAVEVDVRRCGSGDPVVVHDETVDRVTGASGRVAAMTAAELSSLSVEGTEAGVPTLADVVAATPRSVDLIVELKEAGLAADVLSACEAFEGGVLVQSFEPAHLRRVREVAPDVPRSLLFVDDPAANLRTATALDCSAVGAHHELCTPSLVADAREAGLDVYGWTARDRETAAALVDAGVDAVVSDLPGVLASSGGAVDGR